jgi:hypothetical protein
LIEISLGWNIRPFCETTMSACASTVNEALTATILPAAKAAAIDRKGRALSVFAIGRPGRFRVAR